MNKKTFTRTISETENYTHEYSLKVPSFIKGLNDFKKQIKSALIEKDSAKAANITFCHPIDVPPAKS